MKQMTSRLEFLQKVYPLIESTNTIVSTVQDWVKDHEITAHHADLLSRSLLAQKIVAELKFMLWDMALTWDHENDGQILSIQSFEDIDKHFESIDRAIGHSARDSDSYAMDLKILWQVAQIASESLRDIFKCYFFTMPSDSEYIIVPQPVILTLEKLQRDLPDKLWWLEQILADVEYVIGSNKAQAGKKVSKKPKNFSHASSQVR